MKTENNRREVSKVPYSQICKPFEEAKAFAQSLGLKDLNEWVDYCRSGQKPNDIPQKPDRIYKNKGWKSYGDWLGVWKANYNTEPDKILDNAKQYLPFEEAKSFAQSLHIRNVKEWFKYCDSGKRPKNIPYNPDRAYKNDGWKSYPDWLGTVAIAKDFEYKNFEDARDFVHQLQLEGNRAWNEYCKSGKKPDDIPFAPYAVYVDDGWVSMQDWLGIEVQSTKYNDGKYNKKQAKKVVKNENLPFAKFRK